MDEVILEQHLEEPEREMLAAAELHMIGPQCQHCDRGAHPYTVLPPWRQ